MELKTKTTPSTDQRSSTFRLGLFGDTRSGKTVYLTALTCLARNDQLPPGLVNVREADGETARYLGEKMAMLSAGQWPPGNVDSCELQLLVDRDNGDVLTVTTADFRGGDLADAFYGGDQKAAVKFVFDLFHGCSAYMFLLDPGVIDVASPTMEEADDQQRRLGGIMPALEILRRESWRVWAFHPPVAIVFTKCDRHPEAQSDPERFAKEHASQIWRHLQTHVRGKHRFFAASSTGSFDGPSDAPPATLQPEGVAEPILWLATMHAQRVKQLRRLAYGAVSVLVLLIYSALFAFNAYEARVKHEQVATATAEELHDLYHTVKQWQRGTRFAITHPQRRHELLQDILVAAEKTAQQEYASQRDGNGNLRTVRDLQNAEKIVAGFGRNYPGTEPATRLETWLNGQRLHHAQRILVNMDEAANNRNENNFKNLENEYYQTGCRALDAEVEKARLALWQGIRAQAARHLWSVWCLNIQKQDIEAIHEECLVAEEEMKKKSASPGHAEFVRLVRSALDPLRAAGAWPKVTFRLESDSDTAVDWKVIQGTKPRNASGGWRTPVKTDAAKWYALQGDFTFNMLSDGAAIVFEWSVDTAGPWNEYFSKSYRLNEFIDALRKGFAWVTGNQGRSYKLVFLQDGECLRTIQWFDARKKVEEKGNELFRNAR